MDKKPKVDDEILLSEIIYEILANLPVESLLRFRSVSKSWKSIISDANFQQEHYRRRCLQDRVLLLANTITNPIGLELSVQYTLDCIKDFVIPLPAPPTSFSCGAIQQCRGLVCVTFARDIYVCNPATREIIALPTIKRENHCVGFGYAAATKQFKVVKIFRPRYSKSGRNQSVCKIFTLGTSQWREAKCSLPNGFLWLHLRSPFVKGAIHFLASSSHHSAADVIYAFDINTEEYRIVRFPEMYLSSVEEETNVFKRLNELKGFLCLTIGREYALELWFLKDYDSVQWVKAYTIDVSSLTTDLVWGEPLAILSNGTILLDIFAEHESRAHLYYYNPEDREFTLSANENDTATMYVESLLPLVASL